MSWQETALPPQESKPQGVWEEVRTAHNTRTASSEQMGKSAHKTQTRRYSLQHLNFPGPQRVPSITRSKTEKSFCPQPWLFKITCSIFVTQTASSSLTLGRLYCTKVKCNFSLRLYYPLDSADSPTCTFTAAL